MSGRLSAALALSGAGCRYFAWAVGRLAAGAVSLGGTGIHAGSLIYKLVRERAEVCEARHERRSPARVSVASVAGLLAGRGPCQ